MTSDYILCSWCNIIQPMEDFYRSAGNTPWCLTCKRKYDKEWRLKHPKKSTPEILAYQKNYHKTQYLKHPQSILARNKEWRTKNSDLYKKIADAWKQANPDRLSYYSRANAKKKSEWLKELKSKPCSDCKGNFNPVCMDFDHLPEFEKSVNIAKISGNSKEAILSEVAKCELVCSNCHRVRTKSRSKNKTKNTLYIERMKWYNALKNKPCADCKGNFNPICMDFDHLPEFDKTHLVSVMVNRRLPQEEILSEIAKCELVCSNCHRIRTSLRRQKPPEQLSPGG